MVSFNVNIKKKDLFLLSAIMVFLVGVGFVVAYNAGYSGAVPGSQASIMGHTADEIDGLGGGGGSCSFGAWQDVTVAAVGETNQGPVATDGVLVMGSSGETSGVHIYTGSNPSSLFEVTHENSHGAVSLGTPIKKGDYWKVTTDSGSIDKAYWISLNCGGTGGTYSHTDCSWVASDYCGTRSSAWVDVTCPVGKYAAGYGIIGCTGDNILGTYCDDDARCQKPRVYCCSG